MRLSPPTRRSQPGGQLGARADAVADADRDRRCGERLDRGVHPREQLHPRDARRRVEVLGDVGAGRQRPLAGRRDDQDPQLVVGGELGQRREQLHEQRRVHRVADLRAVEPQELDPVVQALARECRHARRIQYDALAMRRLTTILLVNLGAAWPSSRRSRWPRTRARAPCGEVDDKTVTNAGFILIAFFPLFILLCSLLQWRLEKRKDAQEEGRQGRRRRRPLARRLVDGA